MSLRRLKVASMRFSKPGESLRSDQEGNRIKYLINDLISFCPRAGGLLSSTLDWSKTDHHEGAILEYWLKETPQRNIHIVVRGGRNQPTGNDAFADDVIQLTQQIHDAQGFFHVAVEPNYTPDQLQSPDIFVVRVRRIRKRVTQRQIFQIPTVDGSGIPVPKGGNSYLPHALRANIIAFVHSSVRRGTKLNDARFIGEPPPDLAGQAIPNQILLHRPDFSKDMQLMRTLDKAMDSGKHVRLQVLVNLDWVDGSIDSLTFSGYYKRPYKSRRQSDTEK